MCVPGRLPNRLRGVAVSILNKIHTRHNVRPQRSVQLRACAANNTLCKTEIVQKAYKLNEIHVRENMHCLDFLLFLNVMQQWSLHTVPLLTV